MATTIRVSRVRDTCSDSETHTVQDLSGQVIVRDYRLGLRGGYANVYPGEWKGLKVFQLENSPCHIRANLSRGRRQSSGTNWHTQVNEKSQS
jgi:hypothetical protein